MREIVTIGVYGYDEAAFFAALQTARVDTFCDIRQRRGVRGREYAFVNSQRLQARLAELGIRYLHYKELAPTTAVRDRQKQEDKAQGIAKRTRSSLGAAFIAAYQEEVLRDFMPEALQAALPPDAQVVAFFCVERDPAACHRSLVADRLAREWGVGVVHLV
ncbi:MAG: DUF488 domain-containing protein [Anaerolinea sp.]|nr:DUF488 domain-containing protein [Anaerolinea sp.]